MHLASLDLNLLLALDALLAERSVTRAAQRVRLTQPAMSRALGRLRLVFGDPLLVRAGQQMVPTTRAQALAPALREALTALERAVTEPAPFVPAHSQRAFRIATADYGVAVIVPALLARIARDAPSVDLAVLPLEGRVDEKLATGELDAIVSPRRGETPGMIWSTLFREDFACIVRADHAAARRGRALSLTQLCALPHLFVAPSGQATGIVDELLARRGKRRRIALRVSSFLVAPTLVAESDLVAILARRVAERFAGPLGLRLLELPLSIPGFKLELGWHERMRNDPGHAWFRRLVVDVARRI